MAIPNVRSVLSGLGKRTQFSVISKTLVDYEVVETKAAITWFTGVYQSISPQALSVKPEGQRTWKFWDLWTKQELKLDDVVQDREHKQFRVMAVNDWKSSGYFYYELLEQIK